VHDRRLGCARIVGFLLDLLELQSKIARIALQTFMSFGGCLGLDFSQGPDQRFLLWLDELDEETAWESQELDAEIVSVSDR
jgi:hypothetical protein